MLAPRPARKKQTTFSESIKFRAMDDRRAQQAGHSGSTTVVDSQSGPEASSVPKPHLKRLRPPSTIDKDLLASPPEPQRVSTLDLYAMAGYKLEEPTMINTEEQWQDYQRRKSEWAIQALSTRLSNET